VKQPTAFLDVTSRSSGIQSLVGSNWFKEMLTPYLKPDEDGGLFDYHYAEAFCKAQADGLFQGVAGFYRGRTWGLVVVNPDEVMDYGRPRPAKRTGWRG
jgi:hypothetical protein